MIHYCGDSAQHAPIRPMGLVTAFISIPSRKLQSNGSKEYPNQVASCAKPRQFACWINLAMVGQDGGTQVDKQMPAQQRTQMARRTNSIQSNLDCVLCSQIKHALWPPPNRTEPNRHLHILAFRDLHAQSQVDANSSERGRKGSFLG